MPHSDSCAHYESLLTDCTDNHACVQIKVERRDDGVLVAGVPIHCIAATLGRYARSQEGMPSAVCAAVDAYAALAGMQPPTPRFGRELFGCKGIAIPGVANSVVVCTTDDSDVIVTKHTNVELRTGPNGEPLGLKFGKHTQVFGIWLGAGTAAELALVVPIRWDAFPYDMEDLASAGESVRRLARLMLMLASPAPIWQSLFPAEMGDGI